MTMGTNPSHLDRRQLIDSYLCLLQTPILSRRPISDECTLRARLDRYSTVFLRNLHSRVIESTKDSRSLLVHLIDESATEKTVSTILETQRTTHQNYSYSELALSLDSLDGYEEKGFITSARDMRHQKNVVVALHCITGNVRDISNTSIESSADENHPLEYRTTLMGDRDVYLIRSRELFEFTVRHANHAATIARLIREHKEINLAAIRPLFEPSPDHHQGSPTDYLLTNRELENYFYALIGDRSIRAYANDSTTNDRDNRFLNSLIPLIHKKTEDSKNILLSLANSTLSDEDIQRAIATQPLLKGMNYKDTIRTLISIARYCLDSTLESIDDVLNNPDQIIALHKITAALESIKKDDLHRPNHPLDTIFSHAGMTPARIIKDKELLTLILEAPQHADALAAALLEADDIHMSELRFIANGGALPISSGAL